MKVVRATEHDIFAVTVLMKRFEEVTRHLNIDIKYATERYKGIVRNGHGAVFMLKDAENKMIGALGCIKANDLHNGDLVAIETFWFIPPENRGGGMKLLNAFDSWAKEEGCVKKAMVHLEDSFPDELKKIYEKKGYALIESHYVAEVK